MAHIAPPPDAASIPVTTLVTLQRLVNACNGAVAVVSGRPLAEIDKLLMPLVLPAAGLHGAQWRVFQPLYASGPHKHMTAVTMQLIGGSLLRYGLATEAEIDTLAQKLSAFADDPSTLAALPRIVQVWGTV